MAVNFKPDAFYSKFVTAFANTIQQLKMYEPMFAILLSAAGCILLIKTVLFIKEFQDKKLKCWFYFNLQEIMLSSTDNRRREKQRQNNFSIFLLLAIMLSTIWYFMFLAA